MPTTPNYSFPFPALSDVPNVPADLEALAEAIDVQLADQLGVVVVRGGNLNVDLSATAPSAPIAIGYTYPDNTYTVLLTINAGNSVQVLKPTGRTTTSFQVEGYTASGAQASGQVRVMWLTIGTGA